LLEKAIEKSLKKAQIRLGRPAMPASPYRRMDSGAIGSLVASYPLKIFDGNDERLINTTDFLMNNCLVKGGFFHDMTHSGINPYLTLSLAQVLLRAKDQRYFELIKAVAKLASPTGQWPESIHPLTGGGCMGDGQHIWASAEWVLMIRNMFVREEGNRLILASGIPLEWLKAKEKIFFGPAPTQFGEVSITIMPSGNDVLIKWQGKWFNEKPPIEISFPGFAPIKASTEDNQVTLKFWG